MVVQLARCWFLARRRLSLDGLRLELRLEAFFDTRLARKRLDAVGVRFVHVRALAVQPLVAKVAVDVEALVVVRRLAHAEECACHARHVALALATSRLAPWQRAALGHRLLRATARLAAVAVKHARVQRIVLFLLVQLRLFVIGAVDWRASSARGCGCG